MSIIGELFRLKGEPWRDNALCLQIGVNADFDPWFPDKHKDPKVGRDVCLRCPVRADCLKWAIENGERHGVFGGFTERDRNRLMRGGNPLRGPGRPAGTAHRPNGHGIACKCVVCRRVA